MAENILGIAKFHDGADIHIGKARTRKRYQRVICKENPSVQREHQPRRFRLFGGVAFGAHGRVYFQRTADRHDEKTVWKEYPFKVYAESHPFS